MRIEPAKTSDNPGATSHGLSDSQGFGLPSTYGKTDLSRIFDVLKQDPYFGSALCQVTSRDAERSETGNKVPKPPPGPGPIGSSEGRAPASSTPSESAGRLDTGSSHTLALCLVAGLALCGISVFYLASVYGLETVLLWVASLVGFRVLYQCLFSLCLRISWWFDSPEPLDESPEGSSMGQDDSNEQNYA